MKNLVRSLATLGRKSVSVLQVLLCCNQTTSEMSLPQPSRSRSKPQNVSSGFVRVLENLESPGILLWHFPGLESLGKRSLVLESSGNLLNSSKKISSVWKAVRRITIEILGLKGLMWSLEPLKNQSESWKGLGKVLEIFFWKRVRTLKLTTSKCIEVELTTSKLETLYDL